MLHIAQSKVVRFNSGSQDVETRAWQAARQLYQRASLQGWFGQIWSALTRQPRHLLNLAETKTNGPAGNCYSLGVQTVPIRQIRGSQGRCADFDRDFCPLQAHTRSRWLRVAAARRLGVALPLVELILVGDIYFVRDGHHRISVARALGQTEIEAEVRVWET